MRIRGKKRRRWKRRSKRRRKSWSRRRRSNRGTVVIDLVINNRNGAKGRPNIKVCHLGRFTRKLQLYTLQGATSLIPKVDGGREWTGRR